METLVLNLFFFVSQKLLSGFGKGRFMKYSGIGGQAVIEGIMMKTKKVKLFSLPFIRGVFSFADSMILGMKTLTFSAGFFEDDEGEKPSRFELWLDKVFGEKLEKVLITCSMVFGFRRTV